MGTNFQPSAYVTMKCDHPEVMDVPWKGRLKPHPTMLWVHVNAHLNTQVLGINLMPTMIRFEQPGMPSGLANRNHLSFSIWELNSSFDLEAYGYLCKAPVYWHTCYIRMKMLWASALMWNENKLYWKSLGAEIVQPYEIGMKMFQSAC